MLNRKQEVGVFGETKVARHYRSRFYLIRKKNYKIGRKEIDLIAESLTTLVFIEVKTRTQDPSQTYAISPSFAVNYEKQKNLIHAARAYLATHPTKKKIRFDVAEVFTEISESGKIRLRKMHVIKDAFHA